MDKNISYEGPIHHQRGTMREMANIVIDYALVSLAVEP